MAQPVPFEFITKAGAVTNRSRCGRSRRPSSFRRCPPQQSRRDGPVRSRRPRTFSGPAGVALPVGTVSAAAIGAVLRHVWPMAGSLAGWSQTGGLRDQRNGSREDSKPSDADQCAG